MYWVIRIAELPDGVPDEGNLVGQYVVQARVQQPDDMELDTHADLERAYKFRSYDAAVNYWRQQMPSALGAPNMPLMAIAVDFEPCRGSIH